MESHFAKFNAHQNYPLCSFKGVATTMPAVLKLITNDKFLHIILIKVLTIVSQMRLS